VVDASVPEVVTVNINAPTFALADGVPDQSAPDWFRPRFRGLIRGCDK
jgi:hypothetical protein